MLDWLSSSIRHDLRRTPVYLQLNATSHEAFHLVAALPRIRPSDSGIGLFYTSLWPK